MDKKLFVFLFLRITCCWLLVHWCKMAGAQTVIGSRVFTSTVAGIDGATTADMVKLDERGLFSPTQSDAGIMATINKPGARLQSWFIIMIPSINSLRFYTR